MAYLSLEIRIIEFENGLVQFGNGLFEFGNDVIEFGNYIIERGFRGDASPPSPPQRTQGGQPRRAQGDTVPFKKVGGTQNVDFRCGSIINMCLSSTVVAFKILIFSPIYSQVCLSSTLVALKIRRVAADL